MRGLAMWGHEYPPFEQVNEALRRGKTPVLVQNMTQVSMAHLCAFCCLDFKKPALIIAAEDVAARGIAHDLQALLGEEKVGIYPAKDMAFYKLEGRSAEWEHMRLSVLSGIAEGRLSAVVTTVQALLEPAVPKERFLQSCKSFKSGDELSPEGLCEMLVSAGYRRCDMIEGKGQFCIRGGIVDFFLPDSDYPLRVDFFGDEIDIAAPFDLISQRRMEPVEEFRIIPASEQGLSDEDVEKIAQKMEALIKKHSRSKALVSVLKEDLELLRTTHALPANDRYTALRYEKLSGVFDYFDSGSPIFIINNKIVEDKAKRLAEQVGQDLTALLELGRISRGMTEVMHNYADVIRKLILRPLVLMDNFEGKAGLPLSSLVTMQSSGALRFSRDTSPLFDEIRDFSQRKIPCAVLCTNGERAKRLSALALAEGIASYFSEELEHTPKGGEIVFSYPNLSSSICYGKSLAVLCEAGGEGNKKKGVLSRKKAKSKGDILSYADLSVGDYVVHINYGVGIFQGVSKVSVEGITKDYIKIKYAGADTLYVPCNQLDLVSKYIAPSQRKVKLNKMGGSEWIKSKAKVRAAAGKLAKELIALYAQRQAVKGHPFSSDTELQRDFEARFPYEETPDQLRCSEEIKRDMEKAVPMDRLLCGDVGFGKTEVALRAVFKCIMDNKQAAILVPTTLLARQHFETASERMEGMGVNIAMMSRYTTQAEQKRILRELKGGLVDLVIGTHRILQQDVMFKDLGLLIVDEEQRFGVTHKERLKEMTKNVDVLTLSATPIPRTLNMAMSGIRDMSLLEDPPKDRHPVTTYVSEWDMDTAADAVRREMRRGGQVFLLHNRVEDIEKIAAKLQKAVPEARIVCGHGKMGEELLSSVMTRFIDNEADVLVCTTIIETGIDIPNVNTLIIDEADRLGLAQLYQIRGRVGRSSQRAYAYFMYRRGKVLTEEATKRLSTVREFTEFGSGFKIALRDLEIRGAGNVLGVEQHGHMESVGYDMYLKLLDEAVKIEEGKENEILRECSVDLFIDAFIPESYIESGEVRIFIYKRIAAIENNDDAMDVKDELLDRFGDIPGPVLNLIDIALLRNRASRLGFTEISQKGERIIFSLNDISQDAIVALNMKFPSRLHFVMGLKPQFYITRNKKEDAMVIIGKVIESFE